MELSLEIHTTAAFLPSQFPQYPLEYWHLYPEKNITSWPVFIVSLRSYKFLVLRIWVQGDSNKPKRKALVF